MEKQFRPKQQQRELNSLQDQNIQHKCKHDVECIDNDYSQEYIINLLHASSIFEGNDKQLKFDRYIRMKMKEKPRESLDYIMQKKNMFSRYIGEYEPKKEGNAKHQHQKSSQHHARQKQQFTQHSFYKPIQQPKVIFIKIISSKPHKCNIQVYSMNGEILKYFSNIYLLKKDGKILKLIHQYSKSIMILHDYTKLESTIKVIPTFLSPGATLLYTLFNIDNQNIIIQQISTKIKQKQKGQMQYLNNNIYVRTKKMSQLHIKNIQAKLLERIEQIDNQEQAYLKRIRGQISKSNIILAFDAIIVNLWRQFDCNKQNLVLQINQLFKYKQNQIKLLIMDKKEPGHRPLRMHFAQNCALCISKEPRVERPRRTYLICSTCSSQNEKPFYLCKQCFKSYHKSKDLFIYKRYQKKTKKLRLLAKKKNLKISEDPKNIEGKKPEALNGQSSAQQIFLSVNKDIEQYLSRIDKLIKSKKFDQAEFGMQMLMNSLIKANNKHLEKIHSQ